MPGNDTGPINRTKLLATAITYLHLGQFFSHPLKFSLQSGIGFRTFAQTIDRLTEAAQITAQSRAEVRQGQVIFTSIAHRNESGPTRQRTNPGRRCRAASHDTQRPASECVLSVPSNYRIRKYQYVEPDPDTDHELSMVSSKIRQNSAIGVPRIQNERLDPRPSLWGHRYSSNRR